MAPMFAPFRAVFSTERNGICSLTLGFEVQNNQSYFLAMESDGYTLHCQRSNFKSLHYILTRMG